MKNYIVYSPIELCKAKRMPVGTVSHGRKKVAEGKWVPVPKGRLKGQSVEGSGDKINAKERKVLTRAVQDALPTNYFKSIPIEDLIKIIGKQTKDYPFKKLSLNRLLSKRPIFV